MEHTTCNIEHESAEVKHDAPCSMFHVSCRGFTLVEVLAALAILSVGLIPAFIQASNAVTLSASVRNSLIATHLAQEGAEVVRSLRDANWLSSVPFTQGLDMCDSGCRVTWDNDAVLPLAGNPALKLDPLTGLYQYTSGDDTLFHRSIIITPISDHELVEAVTVTWQERSIDKSFEVEYHLYDWNQ